MISKKGGTARSINENVRVNSISRPSRCADSQADHRIVSANWCDGSRLDPFSAAVKSGIEQDFVEGAAQDVPGTIGNLIVIFVAPNERNPELVFPIGAITHRTVLQGVILSFDRRPETEFLECQSGRAGERFTNVISWERVALDDQRLDATSQKIHRGTRSGWTAAEDYHWVLLRRHLRNLLRIGDDDVFAGHIWSRELCCM